MRDGIDVIVLRRDHVVVPAALRVGQVAADRAGHLGAPGHGERAALAKVVLYVHDHQRSGHNPSLTSEAASGTAPGPPRQAGTVTSTPPFGEPPPLAAPKL